MAPPTALQLRRGLITPGISPSNSQYQNPLSQLLISAQIKQRFRISQPGLLQTITVFEMQAFKFAIAIKTGRVQLKMSSAVTLTISSTAARTLTSAQDRPEAKSLVDAATTVNMHFQLIHKKEKHK